MSFYESVRKRWNHDNHRSEVSCSLASQPCSPWGSLPSWQWAPTPQACLPATGSIPTSACWRDGRSRSRELHHRPAQPAPAPCFSLATIACYARSRCSIVALGSIGLVGIPTLTRWWHVLGRGAHRLRGAQLQALRFGLACLSYRRGYREPTRSGVRHEADGLLLASAISASPAACPRSAVTCRLTCSAFRYRQSPNNGVLRRMLPDGLWRALPSSPC